MSNSVSAISSIIVPPNTPTVPSKKAGMHSLPKDLLKSIFARLDPDDLENAEGVCKSWLKAAEEPHVKFVREEWGIRPRKEVLIFIQRNLPSINANLLEYLPEASKDEISSIKHPGNQHLAIRKCVKENSQVVNEIVKKLIKPLHFSDFGCPDSPWHLAINVLARCSINVTPWKILY